MENKSNEAVSQHTEDTGINASPYTMDLNALMEQARNEATWKESDRSATILFKSDHMRIVLMGLHEGAVLKTHTANGIISVQVLEGHIQFTTAPQTVELQKGQMLALPEKVPHSVVALKETFFLLTLAMAGK